jgi:integrase
VRHVRSSSISSKVEIYLTERRRVGFKLRGNGAYLRSFARFSERRRHRGPITSNLILAWAQASRRASAHMAAFRLSTLQPFLKYWNQRDPTNQLVPTGLFGRGYPRIRPHIYTVKEIRDLIAAASRWPTETARADTYAAIFGLLAATGLRVSEALKLRRNDADLDQGVLTIRGAKFNKNRYVPLHPSTTHALKRYGKRGDRDSAGASAEYFFAIDGKPVSICTLDAVFRRLCKSLSWRGRGDRPRPRIQDLRSSFICRRIENWYAQGRDVNCLMLSLSTYVGHTRPSATYWYLTTTPRLMALAARRSGGRS